MSLSLSIIFGVVPVAMSAWKPEIAPHAMVMKTNGNSGPGMIGPPPPTNCENAGACSVGWTMMTPSARKQNRADLHERAEVVARRQQHPHRQHRGGEAVDRQRDRDLMARQQEAGADRRFGDGLAEDDGQEHQR